MKTLSDLKKHIHIYELSLIHNSWYKSVPEHQTAWRSVARVKSNKFSLNTMKDCLTTESWLDFPKASELTLKIENCEIIMTIKRVIHGGFGVEDSTHTMIYKLRPNLNTLDNIA